MLPHYCKLRDRWRASPLTLTLALSQFMHKNESCFKSKCNDDLFLDSQKSLFAVFSKLKMLLFFVVTFFTLSTVNAQLLPNLFGHSFVAGNRLHLSRNESVLDQMLKSSTFASRPQLFNLFKRNRADINQCYDASVGNGQQIDIFSLDIFSVVHRFFVSNQKCPSFLV